MPHLRVDRENGATRPRGDGSVQRAGLRREAGVARAVGVYRRVARADKGIPDISGGFRNCAEIVTVARPRGTCTDVRVFGILLPTIPDSSMVEHPAVNRVVPGS